MKKTFLILAAGIAATLSGFSQAPTEKNVAPAAATAPAVAGTTLPVARTLTSNDGRTIDVTILSKTATAITAARADGKEFEITLDKLSDADKAFVAGLPGPKKPSILFVIKSKHTSRFFIHFVEDLIRQGFDVTFGLTWEKVKPPDHEIPRKLGDLLGANAVFIIRPEDTAKYSIVWIASPAQVYSEEKDFEIFSYRNSNKLPIVANFGESWLNHKEYLLTGEGGPEKKEATEDEPNYCNKVEGKWLFYWDQKEGPSQKTIRNKVLREIRGLLDN